MKTSPSLYIYTIIPKVKKRSFSDFLFYFIIHSIIFHWPQFGLFVSLFYWKTFHFDINIDILCQHVSLSLSLFASFVCSSSIFLSSIFSHFTIFYMIVCCFLLLVFKQFLFNEHEHVSHTRNQTFQTINHPIILPNNNRKKSFKKARRKKNQPQHTSNFYFCLTSSGIHLKFGIVFCCKKKEKENKKEIEILQNKQRILLHQFFEIKKETNKTTTTTTKKSIVSYQIVFVPKGRKSRIKL